MTPTIIEVAVSGFSGKARNPNNPVSPEEVSTDLLACIEAGASILPGGGAEGGELRPATHVQSARRLSRDVGRLRAGLGCGSAVRAVPRLPECSIYRAEGAHFEYCTSTLAAASGREAVAKAAMKSGPWKRWLTIGSTSMSPEASIASTSGNSAG
jgi:hypothetical protein